jgi:hypothetical protein
MSAITLFEDQGVTGFSKSIGNEHRIIDSHVVQVTFTGSPSAVSLYLQGSLDKVSWFNLAEHIATADQLSDGQLMYHVVYKPVTFIRLSLETLSGGSNPKVTAKYSFSVKYIGDLV